MDVHVYFVDGFQCIMWLQIIIVNQVRSHPPRHHLVLKVNASLLRREKKGREQTRRWLFGQKWRGFVTKILVFGVFWLCGFHYCVQLFQWLNQILVQLIVLALVLWLTVASKGLRKYPKICLSGLKFCKYTFVHYQCVRDKKQHLVLAHWLSHSCWNDLLWSFSLVIFDYSLFFCFFFMYTHVCIF